MGLRLAKMTPRSREDIMTFRHNPRQRSRSPNSPAHGRAPSPVALGPPPDEFLQPEHVQDAIAVLTWNLSAVNNNPFEYWLTYEDSAYLDLMMGVEYFLDQPGEDDVEVGEVFTNSMFEELKAILVKEAMDGLEEVEAMWHGGEMRLKQRRIITEFVKDKSLGDKRLISMPDRVTNTVNVVTRKESKYQPPPICRPSVMNNFEGDLSSTDVWWEQWRRFMFQDPLTVKNKEGIAVMRPVEMLTQISRNKYPAISEEEERLSVPLQILCLAIFDAIIVHLMNALSPEDSWQVVKSEICDKLYKGKNKRSAQILADRYAAVDVMCLQEVAAVFMDTFLKSTLPSTHAIVMPEMLDGKRDQNSVLILSRTSFVVESIREVTAELAQFLGEGHTLMDGDLVAVEVQRVKDGRQCLVVSFHGDTNGLLTVPMLTAVDRALKERFVGHLCIFGLDANTYEKPDETKQGFTDCLWRISELGLTTCWGETPLVRSCSTTCSARTSLQPQLNKAVCLADRVLNANMDPKDLIVFYRDQLVQVTPEDMGEGRQRNPLKDNTGRLEFKERTIFPTMEFPSDHGIVAVVLQPASA
mmetsp:Transcript_48300/g.134891  ORF Transcript_48300/g.134891 Transcript_48300/m.134891 type:complete len:583 (+) Transcript_48300:98-1846(+)